VTGRVRPPAVAGSFYPRDPRRLAGTVDALLDAAGALFDGEPPRGLVVPHAGYAYSGPVAAAGFAALRPRAEQVRRVAVLGPSHFVPLSGAAVSEARAWGTPLGEVAVDGGLREIAVSAGAVPDEGPHAGEHAVEVELPFLQRMLPAGFAVLPVAVGETEAARVADLVGVLWAEADAVVVSTDLSHYLDDARTRARDRETAGAVVRREPDGIGCHDACGVFALRGLVEHARRVGLTVRLLDLRTSADTAGDAARVVGYGAFAVG
jgi:hypothetical protein